MKLEIDELLLNPKTRTEVLLYLKRPAHALLITGLPGSGKTTLSLTLAASLLEVGSVHDYPYFLHLTKPEDKQDIPIEEVREILRKLRLKTPGSQPVRRVVYIEDAHHLSTEAQNALLKAIEEPAEDTVFILSTHSPRSVLPTIASRAQQLVVLPVSLDEAKKFYQDRFDATELGSAWQLSRGATGLLTALLGQSNHPLRQAVDNAKNFLKMPPYERLLELESLSKDREALNGMLLALDRVLTALHRAANSRDTKNQSRLMAARQLVGQLQDALRANASTRLVSLELALKLSV